MLHYHINILCFVFIYIEIYIDRGRLYFGNHTLVQAQYQVPKAVLRWIQRHIQ
jgi:hypothetical protein